MLNFGGMNKFAGGVASGSVASFHQVQVDTGAGVFFNMPTGTHRIYDDGGSGPGAGLQTNSSFYVGGAFYVIGGSSVAIGNSSCGLILNPNATELDGLGSLTLGGPVGGNIQINGSALAFGSFTNGGGTTGSVTMNTARGIVAFAAASSTITITNSLVTATSTVLVVLQTNDTTAILKNVVAAAGSFVITLTANTTGTTKASFIVFN